MKKRKKAVVHHKKIVHHRSNDLEMTPVIKFGVVFFMVAAMMVFAFAVKKYMP